MAEENSSERPRIVPGEPVEPADTAERSSAELEVQDAIEQEARVMVASVNLPEQGPIPEDRKLEICARVNALRARHRITYKTMVKQIGGKISEQVLCLILNRKYNASDDDALRRLNAWAEATERRMAAMRPAGICDTSVVRLGRSGCDYAKSHGCIVLMTGAAGIGKTSMARVYCAEDMNAILFRIQVTHVRPAGFLRQLADAIHVECRSRSVSELMDAVIERLKGSNRLLIIDEWHRAERAIYEVVRDLHDVAGVPVVLIGTQEVEGRVRNARLKKGEVWSDQFCSRIGWVIDLTAMRGSGGEPRPLFTEAEIREVFKSDQVRISRDGVAFLQALACSLGMGCLRVAERCFVMAERLARRRGADMITARDLRKAFCQQAVPEGQDDSALLVEIDKKQRELAALAVA